MISVGLQQVVQESHHFKKDIEYQHYFKRSAVSGKGTGRRRRGRHASVRRSSSPALLMMNELKNSQAFSLIWTRVNLTGIRQFEWFIKRLLVTRPMDYSKL
jgi:hypothetical protein